MKFQIIRIVAALLAAILVMILHEFPKAIIYKLTNKEKKVLNNIYKLYHYIDPIGLIFCVCFGAGFSKPYMYRIKDKKTNIRLGVIGYIILLFIFTVSMITLKYYYFMTPSLSYEISEPIFQIFMKYLLVYTARTSIAMFIVNLFPLATFNMGLLVGGASPLKFFEMIRRDYAMKMILLFTIILGLITSISNIAMTLLL